MISIQTRVTLSLLKGKGLLNEPLNKVILSLLGKLLLLFIFFPYVAILNFGSDTQPNAFILSCVVLLCYQYYRGFCFPLMSLLFLLLVFVMLVPLFMTNLNFVGLRSFFGYVSFFVIFTVSYIYFKKHSEINSKYLLWILTIYLFGAILQTFVDPNILHFLLPRERGYAGISGRGVESFASEPTYYGIILIFIVFFTMFSKNISKPDKIKIYIISLLSLFIFSKSSTVIFYLLIACTLVTFFYMRIRYLFFLASFLLAAIFAITYIDLDYRFMTLFKLLLKDPFSIITRDNSINDRFFHIYYSYLGFVDNLFIPHGFGHWWEYLSEMGSKNPYVVWSTGKEERIMSLFGGVLYEAGIFGLILFVAPILIIVWNANIESKRRAILSVLLTVILLSQAIPLSAPYVPFFLGFLYSNSHKNRLKCE